MDYKNDIKLDRNNFNKIVKINSKLRYIAYTGALKHRLFEYSNSFALMYAFDETWVK